MRLINTSTMLFEEFIGSNIPIYAILSHTWEEEEVSFKAMTENPSHHRMKGYDKIETTCRMAAQEGIAYAWVDTCCIDKSSSAELTESINSMFQWYKRSAVCYVYLADLLASEHLEDALPRCRWFTRGWTLQELIAPKNAVFFDRDWNRRGDKIEIVDILSTITGIDWIVLYTSYKLSSVAVAQRMSWAAHRETTRTEDMAYCLLGIFDVNMPLLYGEEGKAFRRLQEEIIKSTCDRSIFAWMEPESTRKERSSSDHGFRSILAESVLHFAKCNSIRRDGSQDWRDFSVSNNGLKMQTPILSERIPGRSGGRYVLPTYCSLHGVPLGVRLRMCGPDQFVRDEPWDLVKYLDPLWVNTPRVRYLLTDLPWCFSWELSGLNIGSPIAFNRSRVLQVRRPAHMIMSDAWSWGCYDDEDEVFFLCDDTTSTRDAAAIRFNIILSVQDKKFEFESMFYALGWFSLDMEYLQCSMVDYKSNAFALSEVRSRISSWDHDGSQVAGLLAHHHIPKASGATIAIPGTKSTAVVSFTPSIVSNKNLCSSKFWRIEFSCQVYEADKLPTIYYGEWKTA